MSKDQMSVKRSAWLLDWSKKGLGDDGVEASCKKELAKRKEKGGKQVALTYQELNLTENNISSKSCDAIVELCLACQDLRVVKLSKNRICDQAVPALCRVVRQCRSIEQLHLSHNQLTDQGATSLVAAAQDGRIAAAEYTGTGSKPPLWLRLERNAIDKPLDLLEDLGKRPSRQSGSRSSTAPGVCDAGDSETCGPRMCRHGSLVHLPYLSKQGAETSTSSRVVYVAEPEGPPEHFVANASPPTAETLDSPSLDEGQASSASRSPSALVIVPRRKVVLEARDPGKKAKPDKEKEREKDKEKEKAPSLKEKEKEPSLKEKASGKEKVRAPEPPPKEKANDKDKDREKEPVLKEREKDREKEKGREKEKDKGKERERLKDKEREPRQKNRDGDHERDKEKRPPLRDPRSSAAEKDCERERKRRRDEVADAKDKHKEKEKESERKQSDQARSRKRKGSGSSNSRSAEARKRLRRPLERAGEKERHGRSRSATRNHKAKDRPSDKDRKDRRDDGDRHKRKEKDEPDSKEKDSREMEARGVKSAKDSQDVKDVKDAKDPKDAKDKDPKDKDAKDQDVEQAKDAKTDAILAKWRKSVTSVANYSQDNAEIPDLAEAAAIAEQLAAPPPPPPDETKNAAAAAARKQKYEAAKRAAPARPWMAAAALFKPTPSSGSTQAPTDAEGGAKKKKLDIGELDIGKLQRTLTEERSKMRLFVIQAKKEFEDKGGQGAQGSSDSQEYYDAAIGEEIGPESCRFKVEAKIGRGVFSSVFSATNTKDGVTSSYALKFIRGNAMMRKAAQKEVEIYRHLAKEGAKQDAEGSRHLINLACCETFEHCGHLCLCMSLLKCDLRYAIQRYGQGGGLPLPSVVQYVRQLLLGLRALQRLGVIHADLKPDNVLMTLNKAEIQICDFGAAMDNSERVQTAYAQPRYYRAPDVMLGVPYDSQIDVWSAGCTIFEIATGKILFTGKNNNQMLKQLINVCGAFPRKMVSEGEFSRKHFNANGDFLDKDPDSLTGQVNVIPASSMGKPSSPVLGLLQAALTVPMQGVTMPVHERGVAQLGELVSKCLCLDPSERIEPAQALELPFFAKDD